MGIVVTTTTNTLTTEVVVDARSGTKDLDAFIKKLDGLEGDTATVVLALKAAQAQQDLTELLLDVSKLDHADPTIDVKLEQVAQVQGELDDLERKLKEINDTPVSPDVEPGRKGLDDIGRSADSSKSVLANMVGNATQDLGALGGIAGSTGVAIGQMGEYMADARAEGEGFGGIVKNFGKVAGPIAAISAATALFAEAMEGVAQLKAFRLELLKKYNDEIDHTASTAEVLLKTLKETGRIDFSAAGGGFAGFTRNAEDLLPLLDRIGLSIEDFQTLVATRPSEDTLFKLVHDQLGDLHVKDFADLADAIDQFATANATANANAGGARDTLATLQAQISETDREARRLSGAMGTGVQVPVEHAKTATEKLNEELDRFHQKLSERQAFNDAKQAFKDYVLTVADAESSNEDLEESLANVKNAVAEYVVGLNDIPDESKTRIIAAIDEGSAEHARVVLEALETARTVPLFIEPHLRGGRGIFTQTPDGEIVAGTRALTPATLAPLPSSDAARALGVPMSAAPTMTLPAVTLPVMVTRAQPTQTIINVTVPRGYRELDAATAAHRLAKRSGGLYAGRR